MFSIAAINDTNCREHWEPLAPTKEAQEFHLTQAYHNGLLKLQLKEYDKAKELLESVLKDPIISSPQVNSNAGDSHLLQLRFLTLKNLANVFLQQGPALYESALGCYLQAVEIDTKDSVVWNQLGTLSCSMGLMSISRWAFEQGLLCSPNNWNCMEKLLEVLIAIGDEVACHSVAQLILRHWPSHSRALFVRNTIEDSEPIPFTPRGIDKLEPKHLRLKFPSKRKAENDDILSGVTDKRSSCEVEIILSEVSWGTLTDSILDILLALNQTVSRPNNNCKYKSGNVRLKFCLQPTEKNKPLHIRSENNVNLNLGIVNDDINKDGVVVDEHPHERRSTRLESLRSRKPGKEDLEFSNSKELDKSVRRYLQNFILEAESLPTKRSWVRPASTYLLDKERADISAFIRETSKNCGAYHMGYLLLEYAACKKLFYEDYFAKFFELEKLTRSWGQDRTPECSLFLAELYYDLGFVLSDDDQLLNFMSESSYHMCKVIEKIALEHPSLLRQAYWTQTLLTGGTSDGSASFQENFFLMNDKTFWVRYFWLCGRLSIFEGNKSKAQEQFCLSLALLEKMEIEDKSAPSIALHHLKITKELSVNKIMCDLKMLKVDYLLENTVGNMMEKEMYFECINLLSPLLFSTDDVYFDMSPEFLNHKECKDFIFTELAALDILIKACEMEKRSDLETYLNCHQRKLKLLMKVPRLDEYKTIERHFGAKQWSYQDLFEKDAAGKDWDDLVAAEVKAISLCAAPLKNLEDQYAHLNCAVISSRVVSNTQSLILDFMCHLATDALSTKSTCSTLVEGSDLKHRNFFIDCCISFCKLQFLIATIPVKNQVDLIVSIHDLLAEYGLCCASGADGEEGLLLKFAIKHLLTLDMKLKSNTNSSTKKWEDNDKKCGNSNDLKTTALDVEMANEETAENLILENYSVKENVSSTVPSQMQEVANTEYRSQNLENLSTSDQDASQFLCVQHENDLTEDEKEELESLIDNALDQCFFCLYGLNLRSDTTYEDDLVTHKNSSRGDYQTKEQCADVFQYILPYAKASTRTGIVKLRRVLRAIRKHFALPPEAVLTRNVVDSYLDDPDVCDDKLSEGAGSDGFLETITSVLFPGDDCAKQNTELILSSSESYFEVYSNLYYYLALSEEINATDKWTGFVLTKEGEEFVQQNANLVKYDLLYNPMRFESWQRLANIYDEEVDLLLNDGSKHINVTAWRKNAALPVRVKNSRRRSRRCLFMSLALAQTPSQKCEIHEMLALVYFDSLQNVVPFYDQRAFVPIKDVAWKLCCENSLIHFEKAFCLKQDWSHAFYIGKLHEKLGYSFESSLSYYSRAIALNPSAVDAVYRLHATRIKLLNLLGRQNLETLKVLSDYSFDQSVKESVTTVLRKISVNSSLNLENMNVEVRNHEELEEVWHMLYQDCLSALEICIEGDLKHFHKARYMLAKGLYQRGKAGDIERAKEELSFCFKSSRSSFTINMWEIDGLVKKGRRKTSGSSGSKRVLEINLPESSRKFITCLRKYVMFYLKLLEETGDIATLDRALLSIRADKRFSLCIEDLAPVALGRYIKALVSSMNRDDIVSSDFPDQQKNQLEKIFSLYVDQGSQWLEILNLPEVCGPEMSEKSLYGYLHQYIALLERNGKLETLEAISEKLRKRSKNPKLSNSSCAKVYRHASIAWFRHLVVSLASITPAALASPSDMTVENVSLCVDINPAEFWNSAFEEAYHSDYLQANWNPVLSKIRRKLIRRASDDSLEVAKSLLKSTYTFYRDSSCATLPCGVNLFLAPCRLELESQTLLPGVDIFEILDVSIPRKLLLWAYTLSNGRYANISSVLKHCEENVKTKVRKGAGTSPLLSNISSPLASLSQSGGNKESDPAQ